MGKKLIPRDWHEWLRHDKWSDLDQAIVRAGRMPRKGDVTMWRPIETLDRKRSQPVIAARLVGTDWDVAQIVPSYGDGTKPWTHWAPPPDAGIKDRQTEILDEFTHGVVCFSCRVPWSEEIHSEHCPRAHRETWPHEWVKPRVIDLTNKLVQKIDAARGLPVEQMRRDALRLIDMDRSLLEVTIAHHLLACLDALSVPGCKPTDLPKDNR